MRRNFDPRLKRLENRVGPARPIELEPVRLLTGATATPAAHDSRRAAQPTDAASVRAHSSGIPDLQPGTTRLMPDARGIERGRRLFRYPVDRARQGDAVGIPYGHFIAYLHGVERFRDVAGRNYLPSDSEAVIAAAWRITAELGRERIERNTCVIEAGMDTFIWCERRPHDRPAGAWTSQMSTVPYSRDEWLSIFPDASRRLVTGAELNHLDTEEIEREDSQRERTRS
jgi:hypothetical protein